MASPGQLVKCVAEAFGLPPATVMMHDRALADAGLRTLGGRGPSAAKVTALDAARLMIAVAAAPISGPTIAQSVEFGTRYAQLRAVDRKQKPVSWPRLSPECFRVLQPGHPLEVAVAALIQAAGNGTINFDTGAFSPGRSSAWNVRFQFKAPTAAASINCVSGINNFVALSYLGEGIPTGDPADLIQERGFSNASIEAVAKLLFSSASPRSG